MSKFKVGDEVVHPDHPHMSGVVTDMWETYGGYNFVIVEWPEEGYNEKDLAKYRGKDDD